MKHQVVSAAFALAAFVGCGSASDAVDHGQSTQALVAGTLDTSFGVGGKVRTDFGGLDQAYAAAVQSDGKLILAGFTDVGGADQFALARYEANGTLDTTFGAGGKVTTSFDGGGQAVAVSIQSDGKILAAGRAGTLFGLARYTTSGILDETFGDSGRVATRVGRSNLIRAMVLQHQADETDKIVVMGQDFTVARYNPNGSLDLSFGRRGFAKNRLNAITEGRALALQPQLEGPSKIILVGDSATRSGDPDLTLARLTADGALDRTFGDGGKVITNLRLFDGTFRSWDFGRSVAVQSDGKLVVAGTSFFNESNRDIALARYTFDGALDGTFGDGGKVVTDVGMGDDARDVVLQSDGKLVLAVGGSLDFVVARFDNLGALDPTFGTNGVAATDFAVGSPPGAFDSATRVVLQPGGQIVLCGTSDVGGPDTSNFALARYISSEP